MNLINLHIHSKTSDGIYNEKEIIDKAKTSNLKVISITDHDIVGYSHELIKYAKSQGIKLVLGVELTAQFSKGQCHILGYNISPEVINVFCSKIKKNRINKAKKMVEKANLLGYAIDYDQILKLSSNGIISRRDISKVLVQKGYFNCENQAIETLFSVGAPCYIETIKNTIEDCIKVIKECGGIAILAHPWTLNITLEELESFLIKYDFDGLEVYNHNISEKAYKNLEDIALRHNLCSTFGTDFHGCKGLDDFIVDKDIKCNCFFQKIGDSNGYYKKNIK